MQWLVWQGYSLYLPVGHSPDCDLIASDGAALLRVQVKTSTVYRKRRWEVTLCTRGGNQSWSGLVKLFSPARCDRLFVFVADGRRLSLHVGGGITWRSDPAAEWAETVAKARGPLRAIGAIEGGSPP